MAQTVQSIIATGCVQPQFVPTSCKQLLHTCTHTWRVSKHSPPRKLRLLSKRQWRQATVCNAVSHACIFSPAARRCASACSDKVSMLPLEQAPERKPAGLMHLLAPYRVDASKQAATMAHVYVIFLKRRFCPCELLKNARPCSS